MKTNTPEPDAPCAFSFGRYHIDLVEMALLRDDEPVALRPKSFDVLLVLVRNPRMVLSRELLIDAVWPDLVVTDDSLTQCLTEIRKAIGDEARTLIKTIPRRGYRLDAEVTAIQASGLRGGATAAAVHPGTSHHKPARWIWFALLLLAVAIAATWWRIDTRLPEAVGIPDHWQAPPSSIAVLPFADMSDSGDHQYLGDGIAEEILNLLAQAEELTVIARTSSFAFDDGATDIGLIAHRLNVAHVLEGSVRISGDRVRVTAQLVDAATQAHVWSESYDDSLEDVFGLQDRVAASVADVLRVELAIHPNHRPGPEAWEAYIRGRYFYGRRSEGDIVRAQRSFEQALAADPGFADAWVLLAATLNLRWADPSAPEAVRISHEEAVPKIRDALRHALAVDPDNPEALWREAMFLGYLDGDLLVATEMAGRAMAKGSNHALVQAMMGGIALDAGHPQLAIPFFRRASALDPLSASHLRNLASVLFLNQRLGQAESVLQHLAELVPGASDEAQARIVHLRILQGDLVPAKALVGELPAGAEADEVRALVGYFGGDADEGEQAMARLHALPAEQSAAHLACVYALTGETDLAFNAIADGADAISRAPLGRAGRSRLVVLQYSPCLQSLHNDPRWERWFARADKLLPTALDPLIIERLRIHLAQHQELYSDP